MKRNSPKSSFVIVSTLIFTISIFATSVFPSYAYSLDKVFVSSAYKLQELKFLISYIQEQQELKTTAMEINNLQSGIDQTNLELLIKTQFYRVFLNHSQKLKSQFPGGLEPVQRKRLTDKLKQEPETKFTGWFIRNLLKDYDEIASRTRSYLTPWLKAYTAFTRDNWRNEIEEITKIYFLKLNFDLGILSKNSLPLRDPVSQHKVDKVNLAGPLFSFKYIEESIPKSKSESIGDINKKLPKSP